MYFKKNIRLKLFIFCNLLFGIFPLAVHAYTSPGTPTGYVNDYAEIFSADQKNALETKLHNFTASTTHELAIVTIKTTGDESVEEYAVNLFKEWGIGTKENDNGVLLLIATEDRAMRIEVGYGLEGAVTDGEAGAIIRNILTPAFRKNNFYDGVDRAANRLIDLITEAETPLVPRVEGPYDFVYGLLFFGVLLLIFVGFVFLLIRLLQRLVAWLRKHVPASSNTSTTSKDKSTTSRSTRTPGSSSGGSSGSSFGGFGGGSSGGGGASGKW